MRRRYVEGVVDQPMLTGPGPGSGRVPADASVRRESLREPIVAFDPGSHQLRVGRHRALGGEALHQVGAHALNNTAFKTGVNARAAFALIELEPQTASRPGRARPVQTIRDDDSSIIPPSPPLHGHRRNFAPEE